MARLGPGQCFGEIGALEDAPRNPIIFAGEDSVILPVPGGLLYHENSAVSHKVALILLKQLAKKLREADRVIKMNLAGHAHDTPEG